jgi:hypothetical protein
MVVFAAVFVSWARQLKLCWELTPFQLYLFGRAAVLDGTGMLQCGVTACEMPQWHKWT